MRHDGGGVAEGPYVDGMRQGRWVLRLADGTRFEGEIRDGKPNGFGTISFRSGVEYEGQWRDGCFNRRGRRYWLFTTKEACGFK